MKYAIIIPDGAADHPLDVLDGKTPFQVAHMPHTDAIAIEGRQGTVSTTPEGFAAGSDVCSMALVGYDPVVYHTGRAPLEAAAMGLEVEPADWIFRCNLVTVTDGDMVDHSGGHIGTAEGTKLLTDFAEHAAAKGLADGLTFHPGVSYRNLMVDRAGRDYRELNCDPPHDIPGHPIARHLPRGGGNASFLQALIQESEAFFADHEVNRTRRELGEPLVTHIWLWGPGQRPKMPTFEQVYGLRGGIITAVDLLAGIGALIGWDRIDVPGITGYHDTNYAGKGEHACAALDEYDIVCVHVEAPDEASHQADAATKVAAIVAIDEHVVGPLVEKLRSFDEGWRVLYLPDHYTCVSNRLHDPTPPPVCMAGTGISRTRGLPFNEANAGDSGLHIAFGHELMEFFLRSGL